TAQVPPLSDSAAVCPSAVDAPTMRRARRFVNAYTFQTQPLHHSHTSHIAPDRLSRLHECGHQSGINAEADIRPLRAHILFAVPLVCVASSAQPQAPKLAFPPSAPDVAVSRDIRFGVAGSTALAMDVYSRPHSTNDGRPVLIFFNHATGADRSSAL